ncbi:hypothetical protein [Bradyrhizobium elkanii]|nr:hypothetical protein [Bradyrhizobium elkanii]MCS3690908.1 hypothetical protein [Bradyrhizobium elkanii]
MSNCTLAELLATSSLIVTLERICRSGVLTMEDEIRARYAIGRAYEAFGMDSIAERPTADVIEFPTKAI